jgi:hypothetical protein
MTYEKPEVAVLGDATRLIQAVGKDNIDTLGHTADCDLDD